MQNRPARVEEVEVICSGCGYRTVRTVERLRRETEILCPSCGRVILPAGDERDPSGADD